MNHIEGDKLLRLNDTGAFVTKKVDREKITAASFTGVDNLLPNKRGRVNPSYGPSTSHVTHYQPKDILIGNIRPYLRKIWYADISGGASGDVLVYRVSDEFRNSVDQRYIFHVMSSESFFHHVIKTSKGAKMPRGDKKSILNFCFTLPPIETQREIVDILDTFAELEAELEASKKQYTFYREKLLAPPKT